MGVKEKVKEVIAECFAMEVSEIKDESTLVDDLGADSLEVIELAMDLENEFDIDVSDEEIAGWLTVQDVVNSVQALVR